MKSTGREQQLNNAGFSLVELIVSVLITAFIMGMIVAFISISRRTYENINSEAKLQTEAQMATNYINELLLEAQDCGSGTFHYDKGGVSGDADVIWIKAPDNSSASRDVSYDYFIIRERSSNVLRFSRQVAVAGMSETVKSPTGLATVTAVSSAVQDRYALLAECVTGITMSPLSGGLVEVQLTLNYSGKEYVTTLYVSSRNLK